MDRKKNKNFWEELMAYSISYDTDHTGNDASNNSSVAACVDRCRGNVFTEPLPSNYGGIHILMRGIY
jgi:hypothetical protein